MENSIFPEKQLLNDAIELLNAIKDKNQDSSKEKTEKVLSQLLDNRVSSGYVIRYKSLNDPDIPFWGLLREGAPESGIFYDLSLTLFPSNDKNSDQLLLCFGVGTGGINEDYELLKSPWVARAINLLFKLIKKNRWNVEGTETFIKSDLSDEYSSVPQDLMSRLGTFKDYKELWKRYGKYLPAICVINADEKGANAFLSCLLLYANFREWTLKKEHQENWKYNLFPELNYLWRTYPEVEELAKLLLQRKFIILQGPPGSGKTYLCYKLANYLKEKGKIEEYDVIQFHASTAYEDFVAGIIPGVNSGKLEFTEYEGPFLQSIRKAENAKTLGKGYLLVIDEINRGDLPKILGEAIFLLEPNEERKLKLRNGKEVTMPKNFYIIGTMNTADRTLAILDFAIRRRFAFVDVWPSSKKLEEILDSYSIDEGTKKLAIEKYKDIEKIFFYYATDEELHLQPGHTYFIANSKEELLNKIRYEVIPLLEEYMREGRLSLAINDLKAYVDQLQDIQVES